MIANLSFGQLQDPFISEIHFDNCGACLWCVLGPYTNEGSEITESPGFSVTENYDTSVSLSLKLIDTDWAGPNTATTKQPNTNLTLRTDKNNITSFSMHPNPVSSGLVNLSFEDGNEKHVEIYSLIGTHVLSAKIKSKESIDISNLSTGFYMVRVEDEGGISTKKLLIK